MTLKEREAYKAGYQKGLKDSRKKIRESEDVPCEWDDFDKYKLTDKYLPDYGEGDNMAEQTATAVSKLIYKWFNDGDVYDNVHSNMEGWANDLSSYANWLANNVDGMKSILMGIEDVDTEKDYQKILGRMIVNAENQYAELEKQPKVGSVYDEDGYFEFVDPDRRYDDEEDEEDYYDEEDDYEDEE